MVAVKESKRKAREAAKPAPKAPQLTADDVAAQHQVLKRAHMGKAGRLLVRRSTDPLDPNAPPNYAEGSDSSDDEHENRVGKVPMEWYKEYDHIGYGVDGQKFMRRSTPQDALDSFLKRMDDPNAM